MFMLVYLVGYLLSVHKYEKRLKLIVGYYPLVFFINNNLLSTDVSESQFFSPIFFSIIMNYFPALSSVQTHQIYAG